LPLPVYVLLRNFDRSLSIRGAFLQTLHGREKVLEFFVNVVAALGLFRGRPVIFAEDEDGGDGEEERFCEGVGTVLDGFGLGQRSDVLTCGFAEDVGSEGDFGGMHPLREGDADVTKGFMSWCVGAWVES